VSTIYHWHADRVKSLAFTPDGAYLMSGGLEGVLVQWQMESGRKTFFPRLGSAIEQISVAPDETLGITMRDNRIQVLGRINRELKNMIVGVKPGNLSIPFNFILYFLYYFPLVFHFAVVTMVLLDKDFTLNLKKIFFFLQIFMNLIPFLFLFSPS